MHGVIFVFLSAKGPKSLKRHNDVLMTLNCKFMLLFELSGPKLVSIPNFSSIPLQMADFSLFFGAKISYVPFVILLPWKQFKM